MKGAKSLLSKLGALKTAVENDVPQTIDKNVDDMRHQVDKGFQTAQYDGVNDTVVSSDHSDVSGSHTWSVSASGRAVMFIEYGSGIRFRHDSKFADAVYQPASWSLGPQGKGWLGGAKLAKYKGWWRLPDPNGGRSAIFTQGNPSANVMYNVERTYIKDGLIRNRAQRTINKSVK